MAWSIVLAEEVADWFLAFAADDQATAVQVQAAIDVLAEFGPGLGRPLVDRIKARRFTT